MTGKNIIRSIRVKIANALLAGNYELVPVTRKDPATSDYGENTVVNHPKLEQSKITFEGKNNILFCEEELTLKKVKYASAVTMLLFTFLKIKLIGII